VLLKKGAKMKKFAIIMCGLFILSGLSFAGEPPTGKPSKKETKAKTESIKKEQAQYFKDLAKLLDKYDAAPENKKEAVKTEIKKLIASNAKRELERQKDALALQKARVAKLETKISEIENDTQAYVNKKTDFFVSDKGRERIKKSKDSKRIQDTPAPVIESIDEVH
jgi:hypothetical protein